MGEPISSSLIDCGHGLPLELLTSGGEPRVLFVHGACCEASTWSALMEELAARGVGSAALNLRGHGGSAGHERLQEWEIEDYVSDVLCALRLLGDGVALCGHSMGGLVAQLAAARTALPGLLLVASSPVHGMRGDGMRMFRRHPITFLASALRRSFARLYRQPAVCRSLLFCDRTPETVVRQFCAQVREESWKAGSQMNDLLPDPAAVRCPVAVWGGAADFMVSPDSVRRTAAAYAVAPLLFEDCGHMVQVEVPAGTLAGQLLQTLAGFRSTSGQANP